MYIQYSCSNWISHFEIDLIPVLIEVTSEHLPMPHTCLSAWASYHSGNQCKAPECSPADVIFKVTFFPPNTAVSKENWWSHIVVDVPGNLKNPIKVLQMLLLQKLWHWSPTAESSKYQSKYKLLQTEWANPWCALQFHAVLPTAKNCNIGCGLDVTYGETCFQSQHGDRRALWMFTVNA